jgi:hypothetical protein
MSTRVTCPDADALVSYLYGEFEPGETPTRQEMFRHLGECEACASELAALGGVREQLAAWTTPDADLGFQIVQTRPSEASGATRAALGLTALDLTGFDQRSAARPRSFAAWATPAPSWGRDVLGRLPMAAAAVIVLGAALGLARLDVQYDAAGLRVRTGWGHGQPAAAQTATQTAAAGGASTAVTTADLAAFETRLRHELTSNVAATSVAADTPATPTSATLNAASEAAILRRLRQLVEESEVRQQQNLQLRVTELARDFQVRRQHDLVQMEQGFGRLAGDNAQQREMIREYLRNVSTSGARPQQ